MNDQITKLSTYLINPAATPLSATCDFTISSPAATATPDLCTLLEEVWR